VDKDNIRPTFKNISAKSMRSPRRHWDENFETGTNIKLNNPVL
jgi:hypothetical protein